MSKFCCNIRFGCKSLPDQQNNDNLTNYCHNNTESTIYNDNAQLIDTTTTTAAGISLDRAASTTQTECPDQVIKTVEKMSPFSSNPVIYYIPEPNSKTEGNSMYSCILSFNIFHYYFYIVFL